MSQEKLKWPNICGMGIIEGENEEGSEKYIKHNGYKFPNLDENYKNTYSRTQMNSKQKKYKENSAKQHHNQIVQNQ